MGLRAWLRGKPEEDPILGGLGAAEANVRPQPAPAQQAPQQPPLPVNQIPGAAGGVDAAEIQRRLQDVAGDPQRMAAELRAMFPGAMISVNDSAVQGMFDAQQAALMGIGTPQPQPQAAPSPVADPVGRLERLAALRDSGAISEAEFAAAKARLLGS